MKRLIFAALITMGLGTFATGCRSCQSCHDYDSPVADCACESCSGCGNGRAGSILSGGYTTESYSVEEPTPYPGDSQAGESYEVIEQ